MVTKKSGKKVKKMTRCLYNKHKFSSVTITDEAIVNNCPTIITHSQKVLLYCVKCGYTKGWV